MMSNNTKNIYVYIKIQNIYYIEKLKIPFKKQLYNWVSAFCDFTMFLTNQSQVTSPTNHNHWNKSAHTPTMKCWNNRCVIVVPPLLALLLLLLPLFLPWPLIHCQTGSHCFLSQMTHVFNQALHTAHCILHTANWKLHTAHCTLHTVYCTLQTENFTLHTARCTLGTTSCSLHTPNCTL